MTHTHGFLFGWVFFDTFFLKASSFFILLFYSHKTLWKNCLTDSTLTYSFQWLHNIAQQKFCLILQSSSTDGLSPDVQFSTTISNTATNICAHLFLHHGILSLWDRLPELKNKHSFHSNIFQILSKVCRSSHVTSSNRYYHCLYSQIDKCKDLRKGNYVGKQTISYTFFKRLLIV